jgi:hypothetical protein
MRLAKQKRFDGTARVEFRIGDESNGGSAVEVIGLQHYWYATYRTAE